MVNEPSVFEPLEFYCILKKKQKNSVVEVMQSFINNLQACALFFNSAIKVHTVKVQDSQAYTNMDFKREHISFTFGPREMSLK